MDDNTDIFVDENKNNHMDNHFDISMDKITTFKTENMDKIHKIVANWKTQTSQIYVKFY